MIAGQINFDGMIRTIIFSALFLVLSAFGPYESKWMNVSGQVVDEKTGEAIIGAKVVLSESNHVVYTDPNGFFEFVAEVEDDSKLTVEYISYKIQTIPASSADAYTLIELSNL